MSVAQSSTNSALFGSREYVTVSRALGELQARRPVRLHAPGETLLILPVEGLNNARLAEFVSLCRPAITHVIITGSVRLQSDWMHQARWPCGCPKGLTPTTS